MCHILAIRRRAPVLVAAIRGRRMPTMIRQWSVERSLMGIVPMCGTNPTSLMAVVGADVSNSSL